MEYKYFWIYFFFILSLEVLFEMVWFWEVFILKWFEFGLVCFFIWNCLILGSFYFEMVWVWFGLFFYLKWFDFGKFLFWNGCLGDHWAFVVKMTSLVCVFGTWQFVELMGFYFEMKIENWKRWNIFLVASLRLSFYFFHFKMVSVQETHKTHKKKYASLFSFFKIWNTWTDHQKCLNSVTNKFLFHKTHGERWGSAAWYNCTWANQLHNRNIRLVC